MASCTQRSVLGTEEYLDKQLSQQLNHIVDDQDEFMQKMRMLFTKNDIKEQIPILKEVCTGVTDQSEDKTLALEMLSNIYLNCPPKHPFKRILASMFQNYPASIGDKLRTILSRQVETKMADCHGNHIRDPTHWTSIVDMVASMMDNFKLGEDCLGLLSVQVVTFLSAALSLFIQLLSSCLSPVKQNELMHSCLATLQTTNRVLQKCHSALLDVLNDAESQKSFLESSCTLMTSTLKILRIENFMLDCKTSCGMNVALLLKLNCPQEVVAQLLPTAFCRLEADSTKPTCPQRPEAECPTLSHPWLERCGLYSLPRDPLTPTSHLCLCHGLLALLDLSDLLLEFRDSTFLLIDVFLDEFLRLNVLCEDTSSKLLLAKSICLWTVRASVCLKTTSVRPSVRSRLRGGGVTLQKVLQYVWATWEDSVDAIRLNARDIFTNCLKVHSLAQQKDPRQDDFLLDLSRTLIRDVSWSCKGKYGSLCSIVGYVGTSHFLSVLPSMPRDVLLQMKEQTLACYASELYQKIAEDHKRDLALTVPPIDPRAWLTVWVDPVLDVLSGSHKLHKLHMMEYILPKLLKAGKTTLHHMVQKLTEDTDKDSSDHRLGALVTCLRRARVMGLLQNQESGSERCLYGAVSITVITQAMAHTDEQVRLDVLALLCENQRSTEVITKTEFDLMRQFLPWNLNNQSPSFRQHLLAHLRKLFFRLQESQGALRRNIHNRKTKPEVKESYQVSLQHYQEFLVWLVEHQFVCLSGSSFARRTTCLSILSLVITSLPPTGDDLGYDLVGRVLPHHIQSLLECLTDTFEENKMEATKILQYCCKHGGSSQVLSNMETLFDTALTLAISTRPQDCTTAAYLFKVLLTRPEIYDILQNSDRYLTKLFLTKHRESFSLPPAANNQSGRSLLLLWLLLSYLQDQTEVARGSLIMAAANRPLYPTLHCIRYILFDVALKSLPPDQSLPYWRTFIQNLITICLEISDIVSPVVHNSSPEGNVPTEAIGGLSPDTFLDQAMLKDAERSKEMVMLMPEYLVVCCWRNIKEVSLLLGQLNLATPISDPATPHTGGLLTCDQVTMMGDYFKKQLLESVHRGAFELAYAGFVKMADMLWRSDIRELHELPRRWLSEVMVDIQSDNPDSKLCSTRRSAGVPFYIQTLVTTEPTSTGRVCFKQVMADLLQMALSDGTEQTTASNPQVHALNTLRSLYRDTRLADDVAPFIADGLKAAILGFQNPFWAVRNSATLLLSALITRVFGVKRSKDESNVSKKNCQTGRAFFHRYPSLYKFLLEQLAEATENIGDREGVLHLHPALYPVLLVLGRLFPSHLEGADTSLNLAAFIPYVIRCSSSAVYKTRMMSAKALQPLVLPDQLTSVLSQLLDMLPDGVTKSTNQNLIHGVLPQMHQLLQTLPSVGDTMRIQTGRLLLSQWCNKLWLITRRNGCLMTRTEALNVTNRIITIYHTVEDSELSAMLTRIRDEYSTVLDQEGDVFDITGTLQLVGFTEFITTVARLALSQCVRGGNSDTVSLLQKLLQCVYYEVRLIALAFLKDLFGDEESVTSGEDTRSLVFERLDLGNDVTRQRMGSLRCDVMENTAILDLLMCRAMAEEKHHECVVQVYEVLASHPLVCGHKWNSTGFTTSQIFEKCLHTIVSNPRDEMVTAVIQLTGGLIRTVISTLDSVDESGAGNSELVRQWLTVLKDHSSSEQCPPLQASCARVIGQNAALLLVDPNNNLGYLTFGFWTVLVNLLQEDDWQVKQVTTEALASLCDHTGTVQPFLALDLIIGLMVRCHGRAARWKGCLTTLINWIRGDDTDDSDVQERLFDKGEMNTYREDVIFVQLVIKHLTALLLQLTNTDQSKFVTERGDNSTRSINLTELGYVVKYCERHFPSQTMVRHFVTSDVHVDIATVCFSDIESIFIETLEVLHRNIDAQEVVSVSSPFLEVSWYRTVFPNIYRTLKLMGVAQCLSDRLRDQCKCIHSSIGIKLGGQNPVINTLVQRYDQITNF